MVEAVRDWPWAWAWLALWCIVMVRAGGTYALGRLVAAGVVRGREPGPRTALAITRVDKWGPIAVAASFLTVGIQSVINLSAGLIRMSFRRYLLGLVPGAILWATIWSTVGFGAILAVLSGEWFVRVGGIAIVVSVIAGLWWWRRTWSRHAATPSDPTDRLS